MTQSLRRLALVLGCAALLSACNEQQVIGGFIEDQTDPAVSINKTRGDTLLIEDGLIFAVNAGDNLALRTLRITLSGGFSATLDTTFSSGVTSASVPVLIEFPSNTTAGGVILISATATDGAGNTGIAVDSVFLTNSEALNVSVLRPSGAPAPVSSPGLRIVVEILGVQQTGIRLVGYTTSGVVTDSASKGFSPLTDSARFVDTLRIPNAAAEGTFQIVGFAEDSAGRKGTSSPLIVTVQSISQDQSPPLVTVQIAGRVEVRDSIIVHATDPGGIATVGWRAVNLANDNQVGTGTTNIGGNLTEATEQYNLNLGFTTFPQRIQIVAFATDAAGNRGETSFDGVTAISNGKRDTVVVVNGITKKLPAGGRVADAVYNRNLNEVYMTNVELDRVEVFDVTDTAFDASISVGARPWGIALWPDFVSTGVNLNMVMVANSGGTNISVVDVTARAELRRHALPNYLVQYIQTERDAQTGLLKIKIEEFDFSDRPEYLAAVCKVQTANANRCAVDSIFAVFSTTPTIDQGIEYVQRGTVRWENLTANPLNPESHFIYEQAAVVPSPDADTLQIVVDRGRTGVAGNETQGIVVTDTNTAVNTYTLSFLGATTGAIADNATAAAVQTALTGLGTIGANNVVVTQNASGLYGVTFVGPFVGQGGQAFPALVPGNQTGGLLVSVQKVAPGVQLSGACGIMVDRKQIAFAESTFVRNSGNFTHALVGEGGVIEPALGFARAVSYNRLAGMSTPSICGGTVQGVALLGPNQRDFGVSSATEVRDFISNTAVPVRSIAVNFNGLTNLIRADSIYVLDENLRLTGSFPAAGANAGMDMNFNHAFDARNGGTPGTSGGALSPNDRFAFIARGIPQIDVVDTWFYQIVASVPIRDPVIGPLRVARLPSGDQVLIGVTARGVVTVRLPAITNTFPVRLWGSVGDQ